MLKYFQESIKLKEVKIILDTESFKCSVKIEKSY